jgi:hypothetical protein
MLLAGCVDHFSSLMAETGHALPTAGKLLSYYMALYPRAVFTVTAASTPNPTCMLQL